MKFSLLFLLSMSSHLMADVSRFIDAIDFTETRTKTQVFTKSSALIASKPIVLRNYDNNSPVYPTSITLNREILEKRLGESIAHRYQASGQVKAFLTREWTAIRVSPNYLIKISDCSPDELTSSTFTRFSIWDGGKLVGNYAEPIRVGHFVEVYFSKSPHSRGDRLTGLQLDKRSVDILKQHAGTVPAISNLRGYQLASSIKPNTPIKWNFLSKITLVKKGQIVDVFASGNGIYVTMKGMALENGVEGGNVTVRNLSSDKKFQAKVLNENSVKVHL
jgi:flagella basal body P-ring formation protein FlgA